MKACMLMGPNDIQLVDVDVPQIVAPTDAIVRVTLTTICSTDVHSFRGAMGFYKPYIMGHEFCGEVVEVGSAVSKHKVGDIVMALPTQWCGECGPCQIHSYTMCQGGGGCIGVGMEGLDGCFAEYVRVRWADRTLTKIPDGLTEEDVIMNCDVLPTGRFAAKNGEVKEGDTVAVFGVGPIGMAACIAAKNIFKAKTVIAIDVASEPLKVCMERGIADYTINSSEEDIIAKVMEYAGPAGVDACIDSAGLDSTINTALKITRPFGVVSSFAVVNHPINVEWYIVQAKNLTLRSGVCFFEGYEEILQMLADGTLNVRWMGTHKEPLNDIARGFDVFSKHQDGCIKWLVTPYDHSRD